MTSTATDFTIEHYQKPEVKSVILKFCNPETGGFRPLNGDLGWYISTGNGSVRLRTPEDYESTILKFRTLYALLDVLDSSVKGISAPWNEEKQRPETPIGTFSDCLSYTLGADIDSIGDIVNNPAVKQAVEEMAKFLVQKFRDAGIEKFVNCLYSSAGIYVLLHHSLCRADDRKDRVAGFKRITKAFKMWLADVEYEFFQLHPEFKGLVKVDKLTNQKRKFKSIFSIHKSLPFVVVPVDPNDIIIDFERARLPLKPDVLAEGARWYQQPEITNIDGFLDILAPYLKAAQRELDERRIRDGSYEIHKRHTALKIDDFPPCMQRILTMVASGRGPHRALAVFAAYLFQVGWTQEDAFKLWHPLAVECGVEDRIFDAWFGQMNCPNCKTIRSKSSGYPEAGLGDFGYCERDELCRGARWPGKYGTKPTIQVTADLPRMIEETLAVLKSYNDPPIIFQRGGALCWVQDTGKGVRIQELTQDMLRPIVAQAAGFEVEKTNRQGEMVIEPVMPPMPVVRSILAQMSWDVPQLTGLISSPVLRPDGSPLLEPGYDTATGLYYHSDSDKPLVMPPVPDRPTKQDAEEAAEFLIKNVLWDFPFDGQKRIANESRTNALAGLISPIVRPMVDGKMPMLLIDKPSPGTGATLLMDLISLVATGEESAKLSTPDNDEEWRKQISSWLRDGSPLICLDNIDADLKAPSLSRALTTLIWRDRILGKPDDAKYPQRACWYATGNNLTLGGDLARRSYLAQMDAKLPRPWERKQTEFYHTDIMKWVAEHRGEILAKIMIMARAWVVAGKPPGNRTKILGGFEPFTDTLGGILTYAAVDKFLDNMDILYENLDAESDEWEQFWAAWYEKFKDVPKTSTQILIELTAEYSTLKDATPTEISEKIKYPGPGDAVKIGIVLRKKLGRETKNGYKLTKVVIDSAKKTQGWKLMKKKDGQTEW